MERGAGKDEGREREMGEGREMNRVEIEWTDGKGAYDRMRCAMDGHFSVDMITHLLIPYLPFCRATP